jgi:DNA-binding transcriptional MocR family regulator
VVRTQGSGTRVSVASPRPGATAARNPLFGHLLDAPDDGVLQLTCAAPDELPPELVAAYRIALAELSTKDRVGVGLLPAGLPELRAAIADRYTALGVPTVAEQILVTSGAQQALALLTQLLVAPGDQVLMETPSYPGAIELFRAANAVIRTVSIGAQGLDIDAFTSAMTGRPPVVAYLTASFQNPTGTSVHDLARRRIARTAARHGVPVVDDEALADLGFTERPTPIAAFDQADHVITVGSLSKLVWAGVRIGWVRASAALVTKLARLRATHDLAGEVLSQMAAAHLFADLDQVRCRRITALHERHDHLCAELARLLPDWRFAPAPGGQTLWVALPCADASAFAQTALRNGVAVLPGSAFDPAGGHRDHLRIPFLADPATITRAVTQLADAWRQHDRTQSTPTYADMLII